MSQSAALARARSLRESLLDHGVRRVSIELVPGRGPSSHRWYDDRFVAPLGHHIVSRRSQGNTPFLSLVKNGRADLPGPICNGYGGFDEVARIVCMAWANHSGRGGPVTVEKGTIPRNNGRPYLFGWEFEGGLSLSDWPASMHEFMARCLAGTCDWLGVTERSHHEHKTWAPGRKSDRLGYTLSKARAEIERYLGEEMVRRDDTADSGLDVHKPAMRKAVQRGAFSDQTQPGGVAFNDEIATFMERLGLLDYEQTIRQLQATNAKLAQDIQTLKNQVANSGGGGGGGLQYGDVTRLERP